MSKRKAMVYGDVDDPGFQEYVAREHVDRGMPVVELHRGHGIPLGAVKRWIATFRAGGRKALDEAAARATAKLAASPPGNATVKRLRERIGGKDLDAAVRAIESAGRKKIVALADDLLGVVEAKNASLVIPAIISLGQLGAIEQLTRAARKVGSGYENHVAGAFEKAGCEIRHANGKWQVKRPGAKAFEPVRGK